MIREAKDEFRKYTQGKKAETKPNYSDGVLFLLWL